MFINNNNHCHLQPQSAMSHSRSKSSLTKTLSNTSNNHILVRSLNLILIATICSCWCLMIVGTNVEQSTTFPGVSRDLGSFCSSRPSLPIDLAPMIVHVKRNTSFNYKLYLFSSEFVFQTGQIVPRDDFRIHSFPVKFKRLEEFWPQASNNVPTFKFFSNVQTITESIVSDNSTTSGTSTTKQIEDVQQLKAIQVSGSSFNLKRFLSLVPLDSTATTTTTEAHRTVRQPANDLKPPARGQQTNVPFDMHSDVLPGDDGYGSEAAGSISHHDVVSRPPAAVGEPSRQHQHEAADLNRNIQFDRDDQVSLMKSGSILHATDSRGHVSDKSSTDEVFVASMSQKESDFLENNKLILPVGAFSSFHPNLTYLVRKDFDQLEPDLIRIQVDANKFQVTQVQLLGLTLENATIKQDSSAITNNNTNHQDANEYKLQPDDYNFLRHKLLKDPNTRIVSINQIYENWITRNFYTIVYIQRRLDQTTTTTGQQDQSSSDRFDSSTSSSSNAQSPSTLTNDRLIFRGSSMVLLGAEQLEYQVKASAFITEKNGLHYYLEFLTNGKFYLGAIDWTKRPFKIIDARQFPQLKQTKIQYDNEELLLCPPSVCYAEQPLDELIAYGRLAFTSSEQAQISALQAHWTSYYRRSSPSYRTMAGKMSLGSGRFLADVADENESALVVGGGDILQQQLNDSIEMIKTASSKLDVKLHLRDWVWILPRVRARRQHVYNSSANSANSSTIDDISSSSSSSTRAMANDDNNNYDNYQQHHLSSDVRFLYRFEQAQRNDIKVNADSYGFALAGHEIDASYRIFNELYLISANHLITINYTMPNETVTSSSPIGEEFPGLSSTLLDPITGAFYDRASNRVYFFKGDRYVGYDCATKKPLDEFQLQQQPQQTQQQHQQQQFLVLSLPVVGILGRQHQVDGIYHDLASDIVYIFTGMKFYTFWARDFKDGAFRAKRQPTMQCMNEHFLAGCQFDEAYPNPCQTDVKVAQRSQRLQSLERESEWRQAKHEQRANEYLDNKAALNNDTGAGSAPNTRLGDASNLNNFSQEQQMKLRSIAARGGGLLDFLVENSLLSRQAAQAAVGPLLANTLNSVQYDTATTQPAASVLAETTANSNNDNLNPIIVNASRASSQERIVIYLLVAMVAITILVTIAMIFVIINWTSARLSNKQRTNSSKNNDDDDDNDTTLTRVDGLTDEQLQAQAVTLAGQQQFVAGQPRISLPPSYLGPNEFSSAHAAAANQQRLQTAASNNQFRLQHQYLMNQHQQARQYRQNFIAASRQAIGDHLPAPPPLPVGQQLAAAAAGGVFAAGPPKPRRSTQRNKMDSSML